MIQVLPLLVMSIGVLWLFGFFSSLRKWYRDSLRTLFFAGVSNVPRTSKRIQTRDSMPPQMAFDSMPPKREKSRLTHREIMQIFISIVIFAVGMYVLFFQDKSSNREIASGFVGSVISFWLKPK